MNFKAFPFLIILIAVMFVSCSDDTESPPQTGIVSLKLTDAPAEYKEVNITFSSVEISRNGGWVSIALDTAVTVDLLKWNNGKSIEIGRAELEPGKVTQIRLMIDRADVLVDTVRYPLEIPSSAQTGLKLNTSFDIVAGVVYTLILDFDANQSIKLTGSDDYKMNPVIRVVPEGITGSIVGSVDEPDAYTLVTARDASGNVVTTTVAHPVTGYFMLGYLEGGIYTVEFENLSNKSHTESDVLVTIGQQTDLGSITLQ